MAAEYEEEDVNSLSFGKEFSDVTFIPNSVAGTILQDLISKKYQDKRPPEVFAKAAEYATKFGGIVEASEFALVDEVYAQLSSMQFQRPGEAEGTVTNISIHQYEMVALANLNPASVAAARSVIPSLERFADAEIEEMLALLRRASAKYSAGAAGGMAGAEGAGMGSSQGMAGMASAAGFGGF